MNLAFDSETSGLPIKNPINKWQFPDPKYREYYEPCRLVSISWILSRGAELVQQSYYIIKPKDFIISPESQKIHGISQEKAESEGIDVSEALKSFTQALYTVDNLIAHNVYFDINVLKSEFYRNNQNDLAELMDKKRHICTMKLGKEFMKLHKNPKLSELYQYCFNTKADNLHNALADTFYCWKCFLHMVPQEPDVYFLSNKHINLSSSQKNIVHANLNHNILVLASAGSGKTLTLAIRIKYLIDSGIDSGKIMLTTFTRDASYEMKNKLFNVLGYESNVKIGTIDSICREFCRDTKVKNVSQFCIEYLEWIKNNPDYLKRWRYLFVDEFQDINTDQFNIINQFYLAGVYIFAVGDDCQNIYTFRGSKLDYFLNFSTYFNDVLQFELVQNYRNSLEITKFANQIIQYIDQIPKTMVFSGPNQINTNLPQVYSFINIQQQSTKILEIITSKYSSNLNEVAVLAPQNYHLYPIEEILAKHGINTILLDNYQRDGIRHSNSVNLATIHKAKGLEWNYVIIIGAQDNTFPKQKVLSSIKEARRLFYVAVTRARVDLHIMYCHHPNGPSRYIGEISKKLWTSQDEIHFSKEHVVESQLSKKTTVQVEKAISIFNNHQWKNIIKTTNKINTQFQIHHWDIEEKHIDCNIQYQCAIFLKNLILREVFLDKIGSSAIWFSTLSDLGYDFKQKYIESAKKYSNHSLKWVDIKNDIWNVSILKQIFIEKRRKLLYLQPELDKFLPYLNDNDWINKIIQGIKRYHNYTTSGNYSRPTIQHQFTLDGCLINLWDNVDIMSNKSLVLIKADYNVDSLPKIEWVVQIITQKLLCDINFIPIDHLIIINLYNNRSWNLKSSCIKDLNCDNWFSMFLCFLPL